MNPIRLRLLLLLCIASLPLLPAIGIAANFNVNVGVKPGGATYYFFPSNVTVTAGDSITWSNVHSGVHDSTAGVPDSSPPFLWASGDIASSGTFAFTFTNAGFFPYRCKLHADFPGSGGFYRPGQTGAVLVISGNLPPTVGIDSPVTGSAFAAPATFTLQATVTNTDDALQNVQFFKSGTLLGTDTGAPFSFTVTNAAAGTNAYTAVALDAGGLLGTSAPVTIIVTNPNTPPTIGLTNPPNGSTFTAPATYTLKTGVTDDVAVVSVQFFNGANPIGTVGSAPFQLLLSGVAASTNSYTAVATDGGGLKGTSAVISLTVTNLNLPPSVSLTNPASGAAFAAPANFTLKVNATDDVAVASVQYFNNGSPFGTAGPSPFEFAVSNLAAGNYSFTAVATDGGGLSATSAPPVTIYALTNAVLTNFQRLPNGFTQFDVLGIAGQTYLIDAADALTNWTAIGTNVAPAVSFPFVDSNATLLLHRSYRARQLPTP